MKLLPELNEVDLYKQGFGEEDLLQRSGAGERLSELLERIEDPLVVALNGPWGSGKSFFLKRWVGAHRIQNSGSATTVYFDAFAHDYLEDPLIALTGAIGERLGKARDKNIWHRAKALAYRVAKPALRVGLAAGTAGLSEVANPVLDATLEASAKSLEDAAEEFWHREDGRRAAMASFRTCLEELTQPEVSNERAVQPLIVVIDELDRCRPDYALALLEVVKHFFSVPHVHFVLGTNLTALEHSVRARYGSDIDASNYLKRFISLEMRLPEEVGGYDSRSTVCQYFRSSAAAMGLEQQLVSEMYEHIRLASRSAGITLRDVEKILVRMALLPRKDKFSNMLLGWQTMICSAVLLQVMNPPLLSAALDRRLQLSDIDAFYGLSSSMVGREDGDPNEYDHRAYTIRAFWEYTLSGGTAPLDEKHRIEREFDRFALREPGIILEKIDREFLSLFELVEG